jgi:hypothetical protein
LWPQGKTEFACVGRLIGRAPFRGRAEAVVARLSVHSIAYKATLHAIECTDNKRVIPMLDPLVAGIGKTVLATEKLFFGEFFVTQGDSA